MRRVKFPLEKNGAMIIYPDDISMFRNTEIVGEEIIADYVGELPLEDWTPGPPTTPLTHYGFLQLLTAAEQEDVFELESMLEDDVVLAELCPNIPAGQERPYRRMLRRAFRLFGEASVVVLALQETQDFVALLEGVGLFAPGRGAQILAGQAPG